MNSEKQKSARADRRVKADGYGELLLSQAAKIIRKRKTLMECKHSGITPKKGGAANVMGRDVESGMVTIINENLYSYVA